MSVFGLTYECTILQLLDLKIKKVLEFFHHRHLKSIGHTLAKLFIKEVFEEPKMISSTCICHINKSLPIFLVKSVESALAILKPFSTRKISTRKISKAFIPCFWSLLKPIERLMDFVNMVRIFIIFKSRRLFHINFLFDRSI
jgi:hypothetical protein